MWPKNEAQCKIQIIQTILVASHFLNKKFSVPFITKIFKNENYKYLCCPFSSFILKMRAELSAWITRDSQMVRQTSTLTPRPALFHQHGHPALILSPRSCSMQHLMELKHLKCVTAKFLPWIKLKVDQLI